MKRRSFLLYITTAGWLSSSYGRLAMRFTPSTHKNSLSNNGYAEPALLTMLDKSAVREIGQAYLDKYPDQRDKKRLINKLDVRTGGVHGKNASIKMLHCIREDFARSHTLQLRGWILSRTEAQQCALYFLTYS